VSEDEKSRGEKDVQKHTDDASRQIDELLKAKEAEVLEV
jgi:ribosome recycling factor